MAYTREEIPDNGPNDSYLGKYHTRLTIGNYKRPTPFDQSKFETKKVLYFPLPVELRDSTSVGYNNQNLESVGDLINLDSTGIRAAVARNSGELIKNVGGNLIGAGVDTYFPGYAKFVGGTLRTIVDKVISADQITSAIQQLSGTAPNPNPSVMFTGPELREFSHSWTFYPKDEKESIKLQKIIRILKQSVLPGNTFEKSTAILNYPNMVQLNFFPWDGDDSDPTKGGLAKASNVWGWTQNSIIRYKKCVMKNVSVNYAPGGSPGFFHEIEGEFGKFNGSVACTISISFMEIEYMLSGDWDQGTDTGVEREVDTVAANNQKLNGQVPGATPSARLPI